MGLPEDEWLLAVGTILLGLAALGGYRIGRFRIRRLGRAAFGKTGAHDRMEFDQALSVVTDLEAVVRRLNKATALHARAARKFAARLARFDRRRSTSRAALYDRADEMLKPTDRLMAELSRAYEHLQQKMSHLSTFVELRADPLTGAANRLVLEERVSALLKEQTRSSTSISLAMIDIDFFKQVNEARCLLKGDRVLAALADVLAATVRQCDLVARFGGEEFVVVMPHTELCLAADVAEQIRLAVQAKMSITVSIGVAASAHGDTFTTLLNRADAALVRAKSAGRNCVYLHEGTTGHIVGVKSRSAPKPASVGAKTRGIGDTTILENLRRCLPSGGRHNNDHPPKTAPAK